ncbi:MAG TPA: hypothetical protein VM243_08400 [Phycisphaerae bacterium]|nr:hypothetical protein [Phycisphaerae bacterium]
MRTPPKTKRQVQPHGRHCPNCFTPLAPSGWAPPGRGHTECCAQPPLAWAATCGGADQSALVRVGADQYRDCQGAARRVVVDQEESPQ